MFAVSALQAITCCQRVGFIYEKKIQLIQKMNPEWDDLYEGLGG
jgi:hypothetical protein